LSFSAVRLLVGLFDPQNRPQHCTTRSRQSRTDLQSSTLRQLPRIKTKFGERAFSDAGTHCPPTVAMFLILTLSKSFYKLTFSLAFIM